MGLSVNIGLSQLDHACSMVMWIYLVIHTLFPVVDVLISLAGYVDEGRHSQPA